MVYKERLELLVSGYSFENSGEISIPIVLLKYIERWYGGENEPKLKINLIDHQNPLHIECYLDKPANKLLNIYKYELIYKSLDESIGFEGGKLTKFNISDTNYFIGFGVIDTQFSDWNKFNGEYDCTLIGLDKNNKILIKSKQKLQKLLVGLQVHGYQ